MVCYHLPLPSFSLTALSLSVTLASPLLLSDSFFSDLDLVVAKKGDVPSTATAAMASDFANRYCVALDLPYAVIAVISQLTDRVTKWPKMSGRSPLTILAASIYLMSAVMHRPRSIRQIRGVIAISETTVRYAGKQIISGKDTLIDPTWFEEGKGDLAKLPVL